MSDKRHNDTSFHPTSVQAMFATLVANSESNRKLLEQAIQNHAEHVAQDLEVHDKQDKKIDAIGGKVKWIIGVGTGLSVALSLFEVITHVLK